MTLEYGEVEVTVFSTSSNPPVAALNNAPFVICMTPVLPAGTYRFGGNFMLAAPIGTTLENYHCDLGNFSSNIETAPAGGSTFGCHTPLAGDGSLVTFCYPIGSRVLTLDGTQRVYTRCITAWTPSSSPVTASGALNWDKTPW